MILTTTNTETITTNIWFETPETYGAVGDGVTDDTIAVQRAISAAETQVEPAKGDSYRTINKTVLLSKKYKINSPLLISNKSLIIQGGSLLFKGVTNGFCFITDLEAPDPTDENSIPTISIKFNNVHIEASGRTLFDFNVNGFISGCDFYKFNTIFSNCGRMYVSNTHFRSVKNSVISESCADSMFSNCYFYGRTYDNKPSDVVFCAKKLDMDCVFTNCYFNYFKYIVTNGQGCMFNSCVFNRCYSYYAYDNTDTNGNPTESSRTINGVFEGCVFEFNKKEDIDGKFIEENEAIANSGEGEMAENDSRYKGFIVVKNNRIYNLTVSNPKENDITYNTVYIAPTPGLTLEIHKLALINVQNKHLQISATQQNFDNVSIYPNTVNTAYNELTYKNENNDVVTDAFNGAVLIHPNGTISKCFNRCSTDENGKKKYIMSAITISNPINGILSETPEETENTEPTEQP